MKTKEVKLAEEGTIMAKFQKERTDAISEMFDNKYEDGIYPTSKFFIRLDNALLKALSQQKQEMVEEIDKYICENKGIYPFPTIEEEVAREIQDLIITSNKT